MRLYERMYEPFMRLQRRERPDGEGGAATAWEPADIVLCTLWLASTGSGLSEGRGSATAEFSALSNAPVMYGDVLRRDSDGALFECVSSGRDGAAPSAASFDVWAWKARRKEPPDDD